MLASTQSGQTFAVVPEGCLAGIDPPDCPKLRGAQVFNSAQSLGFLTNTSSTWSFIGLYDVDLERHLNYTARGIFGYDKVALGSVGDHDGQTALEHQVVGGVADMSYYLGHIPLGMTVSKFSSLSESIEPFISRLRNATKIPSLSFAYTAGAKYRLKSVFGQLILGGYDTTRFKSNTNDFSFAFSADPSRLLSVVVESITATDTLKNTQSLSSGPHLSLIDSTVPHLWLPRDICDAFEQSFGLTFDPRSDLYLINSTMRDQLQARNPSITIKLVDSLQGSATNYTNIILPYSAFDLKASYPYYPNATNYFPIRRATNESQYTLGRTLLQEAYLIVDYERANFTVAPAAFPDPLPAANILTIFPPNPIGSSTSSGLGKAAIVGIAVGCVAAVLLFTAGAFWFRRRQKRHSKPHHIELANTQIAESGSLDTASHHPHKTLPSMQELGGTARAELVSPTTEKLGVSVNQIPQELETPSSTIKLRFQEVTAEEYFTHQSRGWEGDGKGDEGSEVARSAEFGRRPDANPFKSNENSM